MAVASPVTRRLANPPMSDADWRIWLVSERGRPPLARLEDARWDDMFWVAYFVVDLTTSERDRARLFSADFWQKDPLPTFTHVPTNVVCDGAFAGGIVPTSAKPYVTMRALHPPAKPMPGLFARAAHWLRSRR